MKTKLTKSTVFALLIMLTLFLQDAFSQCSTYSLTTYVGTISVTKTAKFLTAPAGQVSSYSFNAVAGKTYQFSNCAGALEDVYMGIRPASWGSSDIAYGDDECCPTYACNGAIDVSHSNPWLCTTTGTYYFYIGQWPCATLSYNQRVDYVSDFNPPNNDAGVTDVSSPSTPTAGGISTNVIVKITNFGLVNLTSAQIQWKVDGGTVNTYTGGWTGTLTPGQQSGNINIGSSIFTSGTHIIKVWTNNPNGVLDSFKGNDTFTKSFNVCATVGGTYTIKKDGTGNFTTFAAAVASMTSCGLNAPITFIVSPGTYSERIVIPAINGASATNTITFDGLNSDSVILTYAGTATTSRSTLVLDGADYVTFQNMSIKNNGTTYQTSVLLTNYADYNIIRNCKLICTGNSSSNFYVAVIAMSETSFSSGVTLPASNNLFQNNLISGGYYGAYIYNSSGNYSTNNKFIKNTFDNQYYYGMYINSQWGMVIQYNTIKNMVSTSGYGIYSYWSTRTTYDGNIINPGQYGIYTVYENVNQGTSKSLISNNIICKFSNTSTQNGIRIENYGGCDIYHNSIWVNGNLAFNSSSSYQYAAIFLNYPSTIPFSIKNNILVSTGTTLLLSAYYIQTSATCDNNSYYYPGSTTDKFQWGITGTTQYHSSLSQFQTNTNYLPTNHDLNSVEGINPNFVSATDLHLLSGYLPLYGKYVGVGKDVDGNNRCTLSPTLGADESTFPYPAPNSDFSYPTTIYVGNQADFISMASRTIPYNYKWYLNGVSAAKDTLHDITYSFTSAATYSVKCVVTGCTSKDSTTHSITVSSPTLAPKAQFATNSNIVTIFDAINLKDLSLNGPDTWTWKITPDLYYNSLTGLYDPTYAFSGSSSINSQNPSLYFLAAGNYTISLVVSNSLGSDSVVKTNYIIVMPDIWMCTGESISNNNYGKLYDDGGKLSNYSNSQSCKFLINPCSPKLKLIITSFTLAAGDYLKIYDGKDAKGIPMFNTTTSPNGFTGTIAPNTTFTSTTGKFYLEFNSDAATNAPGFELQWIADSFITVPPVASFMVPDTLCLNKTYLFKNTSQGYGNKYYWDLNKDGIADNLPYEEDISASYSAPFSDTILLIAENCGGLDTAFKLITADVPNFKPLVGFYANTTVPNIKSDIVTLFDTSYRCADTWSWEITPPYFSFKNSTTKNSQNPQIIFDSVGCYTVKLVASINGKYDSVTRTCYITALSYCIPSVNTFLNDIGISNVKIGTINNPSTITSTAYTNYASTISTDLTRGQETSIEVKRNTTFNYMSIAVWIDYNMNGSFNDPGERVAYTVSCGTPAWTAKFTIPLTARLGNTRMRVSTNIANKPNLACGPNKNGEFEDYNIVIVKDLDKPVITLVGGDTVVVEKWNKYVEYGAKAIDYTQGDISSTIVVTGTVDSSVFGTYFKHYNVTDISGNKAVEVTRVVVVSADKTPPIIKLVGGDTIIEVNGTPAYVLPGYSAIDPPLNTNYTSSVVVTGIVDQTKIGVYNISYYVKDIDGNSDTKIRKVTVRDSKAPVIKLNGTDSMVINVNTGYKEPGYTVTDNYWKNLVVNVTGTVDTTKTGTYTLLYDCTDSSGNAAIQLKRKVIVQDTTKPEIVLIGMDVITIEAGTPYLDPGAKVTDNYCPKLAIPKVTGSVNVNLLGKYTLTYTFTDCEGNVAIAKKRTINVVDTKAPVISLIGHPVFYMIKHQKYTEDGYNLSDNYWPNSQIVVDTLTDFVSTDFTGLFYIQYKATDGSGNVSYTDKRVIYVNNYNGIDNSKDNTVVLAAYPNPASSSVKVYVSLDKLQTATVILYDIYGNEVEKIYNGKLTDRVFDLNVSSYSKGIYFIKLNTKDKQIIQKLIVN